MFAIDGPSKRGWHSLRPITVEAMRYTGNNEDEVTAFSDGRIRMWKTSAPPLPCVPVGPHANSMTSRTCHVGWWIVKAGACLLVLTEDEYEALFDGLTKPA